MPGSTWAFVPPCRAAAPTFPGVRHPARNATIPRRPGCSAGLACSSLPSLFAASAPGVRAVFLPQRCIGVQLFRTNGCLVFHCLDLLPQHLDLRLQHCAPALELALPALLLPVTCNGLLVFTGLAF